MDKRYRIRENRDFQRLFKRGKSVSNSLLVLIYRRTGQSNNRFGFSISKKFGNAVKRNKMKRRLREICSEYIVFLKEGYDIVFVPRKNSREAEYIQLKKAVYSLLKRSSIWK